MKEKGINLRKATLEFLNLEIKPKKIMKP